MRTLTIWAGLTLMTGAVFGQAIQVSRVVNVASYAAAGLPSSGLAQGGMFAVIGSFIGPTSVVVVNSFPLATTLAGTSVKVTVGSTTVNCLMIYTVISQVAAILPSNTPTGPGSVVVTYNGRSSTPVQVEIVPKRFGMFTRNQGGSGPAIIQNFISATEQPTNSFVDTAKPGQVVTLWGTGLGPVTANEAAGPLPGDLGGDAEVYVGLQKATLTYRGRSGCCAGIDQIAFIVPAGIEGCFVPVAVRLAGVMSNYGTMAISSSGGICSDFGSLAAADLQKMTSSQFRLGTVTLARTGTGLLGSFSYSDDGVETFQNFSFGAGLGARSVGGNPPPGQCYAFAFDSSLADSGKDFVKGAGLDAGLGGVSGPQGSKNFRLSDVGIYTAALGSVFTIDNTPISGTPYLTAGQYTVTGPGGRDVGPFTTTLSIPNALKITNEDRFFPGTSLDRTQSVDVTWSGGGDDIARLLISVVPSSDAGAKGAILCAERASVGKITVPAMLMGTLPVGNAAVRLGVSPKNGGTRFQATGLDAGYLLYDLSTFLTVGVR